MDNKLLNTKYTFTFADDTTAELTLAFYALYQLKSKKRDLYDRYNSVMSSMSTKKQNSYDEIDMITMLYTAYACANIGDVDNIMSEEDFMIKCGSDRANVGKAIAALLTPKN